MTSKRNHPSPPTIEQIRHTLKQSLEWSKKQQGYYADDSFHMPETDFSGIGSKKEKTKLLSKKNGFRRGMMIVFYDYSPSFQLIKTI